jgi:7-keto-8-aminopelargonate synthetase-like enzyme
MPGETHIVPVHVGDPEKCKSVSNLLLWKHGIYIRPIKLSDRAEGPRTAAHNAIPSSQR